MQTCLSSLHNISQNPGYEYFTLVFDKGHNDCVNVKGVLECEAETIGLLPAVINTGDCVAI